MSIFQVKICGITRPEDAQLAVQAGADAIGLNFYARSPRYVTIAQAARIVDGLPQNVLKVGVFVNAAAEQIEHTRSRVPLDLLQLHGDEPAEMVQQLQGARVVRAFRCPASDLAPVITYLQRCEQLNALPAAVLLDAYRPGYYGGTGETLDWQQLRASLDSLPSAVHAVLAGGLTPENVAEAIGRVRPGGVDTASGVEVQPGEKDPQLVRAFVLAARKALGS